MACQPSSYLRCLWAKPPHFVKADLWAKLSPWEPLTKYYSIWIKGRDPIEKNRHVPEDMSFSSRGPLFEASVRITCRKLLFIWIFQERSVENIFIPLAMNSMERTRAQLKISDSIKVSIHYICIHNILRKTGRTREGCRYLAAMSWW